MRSASTLVAAGIVAGLVAAVSVEAAVEQLRPRSVGAQHIRLGAIQPAHFSPQARNWINAQAPAPRARGVTVTPGAHGDRVRVHGLRVQRGNVIGQIEYLGGVECETLGPWPQASATFFDANGMVVDTGSDTVTDAVPNVRYPLNIFGASGAVRAEVVISISCI